MGLRIIAGMLLLLVVTLTACTPRTGGEAPGGEQSGAPPVMRPGGSVGGEGKQEEPPAKERPQAVRFRLYTGPLGFKFPDVMRELAPGESAVLGLQPFDIEVLTPGLTEQAARQALKVEGAELLADPVWLPEGGLALQMAQAGGEQVVTVRLQAAGRPPAAVTIRRTAPATVTVDQRFDHTWQPITVLNAYTTPGPSAVRLVFSKPVRKAEVEQALLAALSGPVRGLMEWTDDRTLTWQISDLPARLDFLLGGAHDRDGLPLPGGIPSLRLGEPPALVAVDPVSLKEQPVITLPPDIVAATLTRDEKAVNLLAWTPGTTKWDWRTVDLHVDFERNSLRNGRLEESPRLPAGVDHWVISPTGGLVAGVRTKSGALEPYQADLVVVDNRGGRSQVYPGVIRRAAGGGVADLTTHLAWSPDGLRVAALSDGGKEQAAELVIIDLTNGQRTVVVPNLPVSAYGTRLSWSGDGRYLLAGNQVIRREVPLIFALPGDPLRASGAWEPGGSRLVYAAADWGPVLLVDPVDSDARPLGEGMVVGWGVSRGILLVRWPGAFTRYVPPGQH